MADTTTKILEVIVDNNKAIASIAEYNQLIDEQKAKQKALADEYKAGNISQTDYQRELAKVKEETKAYSRSVQELSKEIQNNIKDGQEQEGSLRGLRAQLSNLTKEYDALSRAERQGGAGQALVKRINDITTELKNAEEETQRFYRNVGNYPDVKPLETQLGDIKKRLAELKYAGEDTSEEFQELSAQASKMKDAIADVEAGINNAASDTRGLDTALQGLTVAMSGMMLLGNVFEEGSEEAKKFNELMMATQKVLLVLNTLRTIQNALQKQGLLAQAAENIRIKAGNALKKIQATVTTQATGATIRQTAAQKALNLVMKTSPVMLLVGGVTALVGAFSAFSDEAEDTTDVIDEQQRRMEALTAAVERQKSALDEYISAIAAAGASVPEQLVERLERITDMLINAKSIEEKGAISSNLYMDWLGQARGLVKEWEELGKVMESQEGLSDYQIALAEANAELQAQLALIEELKKNKYRTTDYSSAEAYVREMYARAVAAAKTEQQKQMAAAAKDELDLLRRVTDERIALIENEEARNREAEEVRHARAVDELKTRLETEKDLIRTERAAINELLELEEQKHQQKMHEIAEKGFEALKAKNEEETRKRIEAANGEKEKLMEAVRLEWENRINEAANQGKVVLQLEIDAAKARMEALQQLEGESDAEYKARQLQAEREFQDAKKALSDYEVEVAQQKYEALGNMVNSLSAILDAFGEENEAMAKASKVLAIAEIAINTGKAIAAGVAEAAAAGPFPANIAAIVSTVAAVMANIATAVTTVKSAKFASGGLVTGPGTSTSDSIPARLSNGESVINANSTRMFSPILSALNQAGGGVAFNPAGASREGYEFLASAVAAGMEHADVRVGVDEVSRVQRRVARIQEIATI